MVVEIDEEQMAAKKKMLRNVVISHSVPVVLFANVNAGSPEGHDGGDDDVGDVGGVAASGESEDVGDGSGDGDDDDNNDGSKLVELSVSMCKSRSWPRVVVLSWLMVVLTKVVSLVAVWSDYSK